MPPRRKKRAFGISGRHHIHPPSCALLCSAVRGAVGAPVPPKLRRQANFSNSIQIWQRSERNEEKKETSLNLCGKNRQINLGRPARTSVCADAGADRMAERNVCPSVLPNLRYFQRWHHCHCYLLINTCAFPAYDVFS